MDDANPVLARFDSPAASSQTTVAVLSDLHLSLEDEGSWRVSHRTEDRLEAAVASLNRLELDAVLFVGDLVQGGKRAQFDAFDRAIEDLDHPFLAVPGNHDLIDWYADDPFTLAEFERRYTPDELPYHESIGGVDVLALNSNASMRDEVAGTYDGRIAANSLAWLERKLSTVETPLVVVHHSLPGTRSMFTESVPRLPVSGGSPTFENADDLLGVLAAGGAPLALTGHLHFPAVVRRDGVREFTLPSLGPFPSAYTVVRVDERGTTATMRSVADYDDRLEAFVHGVDHTRVQIAAAQLAGLPLVDEWST